MDIIIYTIVACPWCAKLKEWLKEKKLAFQEFDLKESPAARDDMLEKSNQLATPVTDIDGEIIVGFDVEKLEIAIEKAKAKEVIEQ
ncbi:NrdH-redoxin [Candidatus Woesearchaeota archaeon]|nr:NrdH-redoxin [Candidatus Woesearchaeota archaeon]MBT4150595.1 NrdH-redoxin [Candidatus Woesearchaeota archaeon]MBT4434059.1 NrdH-redoxin [Candidatus Woesearchaeota archaeon]MBT7332112.1 NrdH-redoxin [Candidatus Woesearchaeota archaeon]